jgi:uncharacterized membrane protein YccC
MNSAALAPSPTLLPRLHAWRLRRANVEFAVLGMIATAIAFYAALLLELKAPATAAITVWVVANTRPGHVLSKSIYRVLGTILGAAASIAIVSTLNSMPWMLFTALALWIAVCTGIGNMMRHFRAYFGLLAGYTAAFIVLGAYLQPDHVLDVALDRTSAIVIGVLSMSLVVSLLGVRRSAADMETTLRGIHRKCLDAIRDRWQMAPAELTTSRLALSRAYVEAEALLEYANLERPGFHLHVRELRALTGLLLDVVDASRLASHQLDRDGTPSEQRREIRAIFMEIREALEPAITRQDENSLAQTRSALDQVRLMIIASAGLSQTPRERGLLLPISHLLEEWVPRLDAPSLAAIPLRNPVQPDFRGAGRHVLRTFLGLMAAIAFWNLTGWQEGAAFLINGAAFCALSSTTAHPAKALLMFSKATAVAATAGFFCKFFLMPHADGFGTLMLCLAAMLVPIGCCAFSSRPLLDIIGMTSGLFMLALIQPSNHMNYDPAQYASSAIAAVFGAFFLSIIFSLILPTRPEKEAANVTKAFTRSVRGLIDWPLAPSIHVWRLIAHRHLRNLQSKAMVTPSHLAEGLRLLDQGTCLLRLRGLSTPLEASLKATIGRVLLTPTPTAFFAAIAEIQNSSAIDESLRTTLSAWLSELASTLPAHSRHDS